MSTTLSVTEAQGKLSELLELAQAGHEIIIHDPQKGKARLVPVAAPAIPGSRRFGLHEGEIWMSDDFNAPLPDSFWIGDKPEFDRLLVAQARKENWEIVTADPQFKAYPVRLIW